MKKRNIAVILSFFLAGCSTLHIYQEPMPTNDCPQLATIKGNSKSYGLFDWEHCSIKSIDDKEVYFLWDGTVQEKRVTPGNHDYVINAEYNRHLFGGGPYTTNIELNASLKPGRYHLNQSVKGANIFVWVENEHNQRVSPVAGAPYRVKPQNQMIIVPVVR